MSMPENIEILWKEGALRNQDYFFADFIRRACGSDDEKLLLAAALTSRTVGEGSICLDLEKLAETQFPIVEIIEPDTSQDDEEIPQTTIITLPTKEIWLNSLTNSNAQKAICTPDENVPKPLVLDKNRLYLYRYWRYEKSVVDTLKQMAQPNSNNEFPDKLGETLDTLFPIPENKQNDETFKNALQIQKLAALTVFRGQLTLISGGPGAGKTYTIARVLAMPALIDKNRPILLAAPTGKAAMRMTESICAAKKEMAEKKQVAKDILQAIPEEATTIHRMLGPLYGSPYFRYNADNPLDASVVIVDEASMIDLPMMAKLLEALPENAKLILIGDMNQLVSVEPGHVFGDICSSVENPNTFSHSVSDDYQNVFGQNLAGESIQWNGEPCMGDFLVKLDYSNRFLPDGPIDKISRAIANDTKSDAAWDALQTAGNNLGAKITHRETPASLLDNERRPINDFRKAVLAGYRNYLDAGTLETAFKALNAFRVLSAFRQGPYGIATLNRLIENILSLQNVKKDSVADNDKPGKLLSPNAEFYERRPVMITQNDYSLNLYNGDIGIIFREQSENLVPVSGAEKLKSVETAPTVAYFERTGENGSRVYKPIPTNMLPPHETAFAMTIHKSQGSEFDNVLILIPPEDRPLLTRELLYTAITRAKKEVALWCNEDVFKKMIKRQTQRASGLREKLSNPLIRISQRTSEGAGT